MSGSAPVDFGLDDDALTMEISLGGFPDDAIWSLYGAVGTGTLLRYAGSYQRDDTGETVAVEVETRFKVKEVDNGESKTGRGYQQQIIAGLHVLQADHER
ncbi:phage major tail tube protein [Raoultella terrigena]|uniref:Phage major tail tube protein n=1 Tax=Raoultella terrigena TaxID=577 RepID=A0A3P8KB60_RAOTE|nr:phage major tail tube protein [Raoultella terrigena]